MIQHRKESVMNLKDELTFYLLSFIGLVLTGLFGLWWFQASHIPHNFSGNNHILDVAIFVVLSYVVWYDIVNQLFLWLTAYFMKHPVYMEPEKNAKVAFLTAFVPGKEPFDVLEKAVKAMVAVEYPHDTWVLDEGDSDEAKAICRKYGAFHYTRRGIAKYNTQSGEFKAKTKAGNYNSWYDQYGKNYKYVAQIDVDFVPKKNFLLKTLGYFRDPFVAFVGSPQIYGNTNESWIAKGAAEQAYGFYGPMQKGFYGNDMQLFIGANHVVRVAAHDTINGYSGHIVEDHLTGMKFYANKWKSVYVPEVLAVGEGPSTWDAYFSQQMRWAYGLMHILFTKSPKLFPKMKPIHALNYFLLQNYYFFGFVQVLGILLLTLYFLYGIQSTSMDLKELLLLYPPLVVMQQVIFLWLQKFHIDPKHEKGLMLTGKLLNFAAWPIYFLALVGIIRGKQLTYKVTPKGKEQKTDTPFSLFIPHFVIGTVAALDMYIGYISGHIAVQLVFWAFITMAIMYFFVLNVAVEYTTKKIKVLFAGIYSFFGQKLVSFDVINLFSTD